MINFIFDQQLMELFGQFTLSVKAFTPSMRRTAQLLLTNQQGGPLAQMTITPTLPSECKALGSIVIHSVVAFSSNSRYHILLPFVNMLTNPAALTVNNYACGYIYCLEVFLYLIAFIPAHNARGQFAGCQECNGREFLWYYPCTVAIATLYNFFVFL